jgi:uncharacterized protein YdhG (YjbR/CyaY superfamily)
MRKAKSGMRGSAARGKRGAKSGAVVQGGRATKQKSAAKDVQKYLAEAPPAARNNLNALRAAIRSAVPSGAAEIISYGIPAFKDKKVLVWYAAFANHCSLFPTASVIEGFKDELKGFYTSKGTVQFPIDKPLPTALIKKMVRARVAESQGKK